MIIYLITNTINNDFYIGKTKDFKTRCYHHKYNSLKRSSQAYIHRAIRKYGIDNFSFTILEELSPEQDSNEREIFWIQKLEPKYNMTKGGDGGDTSHSPKYKQSIKKRNMSGSNNPMYGKKRTIPKHQLDKAHKEAQKSNRCPVSCEGIVYNSVGEAQSAYSGINIRKRLDNPKYPDFYRLRPKTKRK